MSGGPLYPRSSVPITDDVVFGGTHVCKGANGHQIQGMSLKAATLGADGVWDKDFELPPTALPTGTAYVRYHGLADATSGVVRVHCRWGLVAAGADPSSATLTSEGVQSVTWGAGDDDVYKELKVALDHTALTANSMVVMQTTFENTATTLTVISTWLASIIWE